jgi:hypothetical protein
MTSATMTSTRGMKLSKGSWSPRYFLLRVTGAVSALVGGLMAVIMTVLVVTSWFIAATFRGSRS